MTTTSTLTMSNPASRTSAAARSSSMMLDAPFHCGSLSGKWRPMSPSDAAPRIASVAAWHAASASEWPSAPSSDGIVTPPRTNGRPVDQSMQVVANAGTASRRRESADSRGARRLEIRRRRDLHVVRIPRHDPHGMAGLLGQPRFVRRVDAGAPQRHRIAEHAAA